MAGIEVVYRRRRPCRLRLAQKIRMEAKTFYAIEVQGVERLLSSMPMPLFVITLCTVKGPAGSGPNSALRFRSERQSRAHVWAMPSAPGKM